MRRNRAAATVALALAARPDHNPLVTVKAPYRLYTTPAIPARLSCATRTRMKMLLSAQTRSSAVSHRQPLCHSRHQPKLAIVPSFWPPTTSTTSTLSVTTIRNHWKSLWHSRRPHLTLLASLPPKALENRRLLATDPHIGRRYRILLD